MGIRTSNKLRLLALAFALAGCAGNPQASFGQNVVRYDEFDFKILATEHFDIYYYDEERDAAIQAGRMAERWYARLSRLLNHELRGRQPVFYYASHPHFRQTTQSFGQPQEGTGGLTEALKRRIVLPFAGPLQETDHVLGHELVHAFQFDMSEQAQSARTLPTALRLPLWFIEGMAEYLSVGPEDPHTAMWIRDASENERLPNMRQLNDPRFFPYRFGQAYWAYIAGRFGDAAVGRILNAGIRTGSAGGGLQQVLGVPVDTLNAEWHEEILRSYADFRAVTKNGDDYGRKIIESENGYNNGPMLSPDGKEVVFLSVREIFSLDMFRADAETGEVLNKLVESRSDPHFESIQFIRSAGAWNAAGDQFVFGAVVGSDPSLTFVEAATGDRVRERVFKDLGEIFNPTWSPDGRAVAFAAVVGGFSDLFIYDLGTDALRRLTEDPYADLHPAWSPDGRSIVFSTDRFTTDLAGLAYGNYRLAIIEPGTGRIDAIAGFPTGKNINPQWASDGRSVYFLANPDGITNVYRLDVSTNQLYQVTNLYTGITGITALSPALSSAKDVAKIAFSVYQNGDFNIYIVDSPEVLAGRPVR